MNPLHQSVVQDLGGVRTRTKGEVGRMQIGGGRQELLYNYIDPWVARAAIIIIIVMLLSLPSKTAQASNS